MARLSKNDVIEVHGWVLLKNMINGKRYVITNVREGNPYARPFYQIKRLLKSGRLSSTFLTEMFHYVESVDMTLGHGDTDKNYIEHIKGLTYCPSSGKVVKTVV